MNVWLLYRIVMNFCFVLVESRYEAGIPYFSTSCLYLLGFCLAWLNLTTWTDDLIFRVVKSYSYWCLSRRRTPTICCPNSLPTKNPLTYYLTPITLFTLAIYNLKEENYIFFKFCKKINMLKIWKKSSSNIFIERTKVVL